MCSYLIDTHLVIELLKAYDKQIVIEYLTSFRPNNKDPVPPEEVKDKEVDDWIYYLRYREIKPKEESLQDQ